MIWKICFGLALLFIIGGVGIFFGYRSRGENKTRYLGAGVFLGSVTTCFPVMLQGENPGFALAMSVSHSIRMFVVDTGVADIAGLEALGSGRVEFESSVFGVFCAC